MIPAMRCSSVTNPRAVAPGHTVRQYNWPCRAVKAAPPSASPTDTLGALKDWVLQHEPHPPVVLNPTKLEGRGGGFGMVAENVVEKGAVLVKVPRKLIMSHQTATTSQLCSSVTALEGITSWQALSLHLLCERAAGNTSFWEPYLRTLPGQEQHPLLWTAEQQAWLEGSPMYVTLMQRLQQVHEDTETLVLAGANELPIAVEYFKKHEAELVTMDSMRWAAATLLSRSFNLDLDDGEAVPAPGGAEPEEGEALLEGEGQPSICMVPWADLLNHSSEAGDESVLRYDASTGVAALRAHRSYCPGEEVFDSHGTLLSPTDMLLDYGRVDPDNQNDRLEVPTRLVVTPRSPRNAALLGAAEKLQGELALALGPSGPDEGSLAWLRAALATDAELIRSGWRVRCTSDDVDAACGVLGRLSDPVSVATEEAALAALATFTAQQLQAYPSSLQQDLDAMQQQDTPWLQRQVLAALASEKRALLGCEMTVAALRLRLKDGWALEELYTDLPTPWALLRGEGAVGELEEADEEELQEDPESWR